MSTCEASNARFEYLYRDASNYKVWGSLVFAGRITDDLTRRLARALESSEFFIARQVRVPELFLGLLYWPLEQDDHCWHEFSRVESTTEPANDPVDRTIEEFIVEVEQQSAFGWNIFDPIDDRITRQSPLPG
jgi:hypothetical protein